MHSISTLQISGPDAFDFLQSQLTNDLGRLDNEPEILAAWCNPKGRVIWFGTARKSENGFALSVPTETAAEIIKRLTVFRFRSKVELEVVDENQTVDPAFLVENGYPYIGAAQSEQFTPHMLNLDLLDVISYDKGCYPGQEIVARTHYKGVTKRRAMRFASASPVSVGDKVQLDGRDIGEVLNVAGNELLAVVPVSKAGEGLTVNGQELDPRELAYLQADARDIAGET